MNSTAQHTWTATENTDATITWTCTCGHLTIETIDAPDYHTPIEQRKNDHIREATALDERTADFKVTPGSCGCPDDVPTRHAHELVLTNPVSGFGHAAVIKAYWMGGWKHVYSWPRDTVGLAFAQAFCDIFPTTLERWLGHQRWTEEVRPGQLARYAKTR